MGYFSNGTEGELYEEEFCGECLHCENCPVLSIHFIYNYDQHKNEQLEHILSSFIPRDNDGYNEKCKMFIKKS